MSRLSFIKVSVIVLIAVLVSPALMASEEKVEETSQFVVAPQGGGAVFTLYAAAMPDSMTASGTFFRQAATTQVTATWRSSTTTDDLEIVKEIVVAAGDIGAIEFGSEMEPAWRDSHVLRTGVVTVETEGDVAASLSSLVLIPTATESALGGRPAAEGTDFTLNSLESEKFATGVAIGRLTDAAVTCTFTAGDLVGELSITPPDRQVQSFIHEIFAQAPIGTAVGEGAMNVQISCDEMVAVSALLQNKTTGIIATTPVVPNK